MLHIEKVDFTGFYECKNRQKLRFVYDFFSGSGSTLIACDQTERLCFTVELDEKYCDVIVKRYIEQAGTNETVYLIRDGKKLRFSDVAEQTPI